MSKASLRIMLPLFLLIAGVVGANSLETLPIRTDGSSFRLLTFNVLRSNRNYEELSAYIRESEPDVVVLQEADRRWLERTDLRFYPFRRTVGHFVVASRFKFAAADTVPDKASQVGRFLRVGIELLVGGKRHVVALYNVHPTSPRMNDGPARRAADYRSLTESLAGEAPSRSILLAGDFNAMPEEDIVRDLVNAAGLSIVDGGTLATPTRFPREFGIPQWIGVPVDHVAVRGGFQLVGRFVGPDLGSDHLPVVADLAFIGDG